MDLLSREQLRELALTEASPCVSLYMPTYHVESELSQNPIRLKNLIKRTRQELKEQGQRDNVVDALLEPLQEMVRNGLWLDQSDGMAAFLTPEGAAVLRLPVRFEELVITGQRFHLKPLFPLIATNQLFYVLALSQNHVRLYQGTHFSISEVETTEIPKSLTQALLTEDRERTVNYHIGNRSGNRHDAVFHGHGSATGDDEKAEPHDELKRFFRDVSQGVDKALDDTRAPLVLAGVEYYLPIYRSVNRYKNLIDDTIVAGSPDHQSARSLHERAWSIVEPLFMTSQSDAYAQFERHINSNGGLASKEIREIVPAAVFGRVDALFVPVEQHFWGRYDADSNEVEVHEEHRPGDDDLYDLAAVYTYLHGGTVHTVRKEEVSSNNGLAALFRYPADVEAVENMRG